VAKAVKKLSDIYSTGFFIVFP